MAEVRQFRENPPIIHGTTAQTNAKLTDIMPLQHEDLATQTNQMKKISLAQCLCEPYAVCNSNNPANGAYVADCVNFPDFALQFTDEQGNHHSLIGLKVRVLFNYGITYGSVSGGTFPTLNINGSGAIPLLAQGKTMGAGAISAGQTVEFTIIPYGNSLAFDADSNVREANSDYTVYTDGKVIYPRATFNHIHFTVPAQESIFYYSINTNCANYEVELVAMNGFCRARGIHESSKDTFISPPSTAGYSLSNLGISLSNWLMTFQSDKGITFDVDIYFREVTLID